MTIVNIKLKKYRISYVKGTSINWLNESILRLNFLYYGLRNTLNPQGTSL